MLYLSPTKTHPLVYVKSNTANRAVFTKLWLESTAYNYGQTLHSATCQIKKHRTSKYLEEDNLTITGQDWQKPETIFSFPKEQKTPVGVVLLCYNTDTLSATFHQIEKQEFQKDIPANLLLIEHAHNSPGGLTKIQRHILRDIITFNPNTIPKFQPYIDAWLSENVPLQPEQPYPTTIADAILAYNASPLSPTAKQPPPTSASPTPLLQHPPTPTICNPQPTATNQYRWHLTNPICHHASLPKHQPSGDYYIYVVTSPATATRLSRQVVYATPVEPSTKNPDSLPIPISPIKSSVSLLYWDANPLSPTHTHPIIRSINTYLSDKQQLEAFFQANLPALSPHQLSLLTTPTTPTANTANTANTATTLQTSQDNTMFHNNCKFCGKPFTTTNSKTVYCTPRCRIDYHAGKQPGYVPPIGDASQAAPAFPPQALQTQPQPSPQAPTDQFVTKTEFAALSQQMGQILQLLTKQQPPPFQ